MTEYTGLRRHGGLARLTRALRWLGAVVVACGALVCAESEAPDSLRVYQAAGSSTFNLIRWEVDHLAPRLESLVQAVARAPRAEAADVPLIQQYLSLPVSGRASEREQASRSLERELSQVIAREGLDRAGFPLVRGVMPPVLFELTNPPAVLIIAPRNELRVRQSVLLEPGVGGSQADQIESRVERLGVSALVTPIGGLATYPAMVVEPTQPFDLVVSIAHEWVHARLIFEPLGQVYWTSQDGRAINETVADLIGHELGAELGNALGIAPPIPPAASEGPDPFRQRMRSIRLEVEQLLQRGLVDDAERYMEAQRLQLVDQGYRIRRLNQAYFAFYGSYAESAGGDDRVGRLVRALRSQTGSTAEFLDQVSAVQSLEMLARLVQESKPPA